MTGFTMEEFALQCNCTYMYVCITHFLVELWADFKVE